MKSPKSAPELLDQFYLHMRSALIETAASFDRIQRAGGGDSVWRDPRLEELREAARIIQEDGSDRTRRILELLSVKGEASS
ncbi:MAG: hypothetical protein WD708_01005 [Kiritimatiellia bacterium]